MAVTLAEGMQGGVPPSKEGEQIDLIVAHWCLFGPKASGMYETVRELVAAENLIPGVLAGLCETPNPQAPPSVVKKAAQGGKKDPHHPELCTQSWGWGQKWAHVHMIHSTMSTEIGAVKPKVFFAHGTPEACIHAELRPNDKRASFSSTAKWTSKFDATLVTSKRAELYWGVFDHTGEKVHLVDKGIDLDWWVKSPTVQDVDGDPSILYGEMWRDIKHPLHLFYAVNEMYKENKDVKLNVWGCNLRKDFWEELIDMANFDYFLGKRGLRGIVQYPEQWYSRGDVYFGAALFGDVSRSMQEATACGCPVVTWDTDPYGDQHAYRYAKAFDVGDLAVKLGEVAGEVADDRAGVAAKTRKIAEKYFDINREAEQVVQVLRQVVSEQ